MMGWGLSGGGPTPVQSGFAVSHLVERLDLLRRDLGHFHHARLVAQEIGQHAAGFRLAVGLNRRVAGVITRHATPPTLIEQIRLFGEQVLPHFRD